MGAPTPDTPRNGSDLCLDCGLCCNGVLHDSIGITEEEVELAQSGGGVDRQPDRLLTPLPCPFVCGAACTIYEKRYSSCREYQCGLLKTFHAGAVTIEDARQRVAEAKRLLSEVQALLPKGQRLSQARTEWRLRANAPVSESSEERAAIGKLQLRMTMLNMFLDRHFRLAREGESIVRRS